MTATRWIVLLATMLLAGSLAAEPKAPGAKPKAAKPLTSVLSPAADPNAPKAVNATIVTNLGTIEIELWPDKAPKTVENFVTLAKKGFYDGTLFHRVVPGFVIQGGDPLTKEPAKKARWGSGGPGHEFADEPVKGEYQRGALAMANSGPNTNGSQFFVTEVTPDWLNYRHTIFGQCDNLDLVKAIAAAGNTPPTVLEAVTFHRE